MTWFAVFDTGTGALLSLGESIDLQPGQGSADLGANRPDPATTRWDPATRAMVARPAQRVELEAASLGPLHARWWRWKSTLDEVTARNVAAPGTIPAGTVAALTAQANQAWADYVAGIAAWRAAS